MSAKKDDSDIIGESISAKEEGSTRGRSRSRSVSSLDEAEVVSHSSIAVGQISIIPDTVAYTEVFDAGSWFSDEESANVGAKSETAEVVKDIYSRENVSFWVAAFPAILSAGADYFGLGSITPILPYYVQRIGGEEEWVGYITTAQFFGVLIGGLVIGRLADVWGLKKTIMTVMIADTIFFSLTGYCETKETLLAVRFFCGFFTPLVSSISWVINGSDQRPDAKKNTVGFNIGVWAFSMSACYMLGSVLGGLIGPSRWNEIHHICGAVAFCSFIYLAFTEEPPRPDSAAKPEGLDVIVKQKEFWGLLLTNFSVGCIFTGGTVAASIVLKTELQATPIEMALYFVCVSAVHGCLNFLILPWSLKKFGGPWQAMLGSTVLVFICSIFFCFKFTYTNLTWLCLLLGISTLNIPIYITSASLMAGAYAAKYTTNARTVVVGLSRMGFNIGQVLGPVISVGLLKIGNAAQFAGMTLFGTLCWSLWYYLHHQVLAETAAAYTQTASYKEVKKDQNQGIQLVKITVDSCV